MARANASKAATMKGECVRGEQCDVGSGGVEGEGLATRSSPSGTVRLDGSSGPKHRGLSGKVEQLKNCGQLIFCGSYSVNRAAHPACTSSQRSRQGRSAASWPCAPGPQNGR